jgi:hypothetical protein
MLCDDDLTEGPALPCRCADAANPEDDVTTQTPQTPPTPQVPQVPPARPPQEIEADIAATRETLADAIDAITERMQPANIASRAKERMVAFYKKDDGSVDPVKAGATATVVVIVALYLIRRRRL